MEPFGRASTGIPGLDRTIDHLRLGDNVVWQVDSVADFAHVVAPYVAHAVARGRTIHYLHFSPGRPLVEAETPGVVIHRLDPSQGFEVFATTVHRLIEAFGTGAYYLFDCLTDLLDAWHSDLMVMNLFDVTCPSLFDLDTIAYFCLLRGHHTATTVAGIRETTQLLLELHDIDGELYVHPLKVWARYSPTMFFPHRLDGDDVHPITSSAESARLFSALGGRATTRDHWEQLTDRVGLAAQEGGEAAQRARDLLIDVMIGREGRLVDLARAHLSLEDLRAVAMRLVGTGRIGGKSVGMLLARAILGHDARGIFAAHDEPHDSFFIGADHFYTYVVANGWWDLRMRQKEPEHFFTAGAELHERLAHGTFPPPLREEFWRVLDHFGQSPVIVRSSSLLEDDFGNAFAGKYDSVFLVNRGTPEERHGAFEAAVRTVYASAMSPEALAYRRARGLEGRDEQMALLVQRVSGDHHGDLFFPDAAGVGNSSNLYTWSPDIDADAGMLRMVVGLGTRAVDRTTKDHARIVALADPLNPWVGGADPARFTQRRMDVLSLGAGRFETRRVAEVLDDTPAWDLFLSRDDHAARRMAELGRVGSTPRVVDFHELLADTDFPSHMRLMLATLADAYGYPVDIEFTVNLVGSDYRVNVVQCRPLQTRGLGAAVEVEEPADAEDCLLATRGNFMGGNVRLPLSRVVLVRPETYLGLGTSQRHRVARTVGQVVRALAGESAMALGPGRWGTTTPSLGVPVHFAEISGVAVLGEVTHASGGFLPELSWGSHFFQDLVETGIFYVAVMEDTPGTVFNPGWVLTRENLLASLVPEAQDLADVVHVAPVPDLVLAADVVSQRLVCR